MEKTGKIILVTGATGRQGGATARHLMAAGWQVRAFTRSRNSPAAQALHRAGAEIVQGDNNDRASLKVAMQGIYGIFSLQFASYADEVRQGKNMAEAAKEARVQHFVYASTSGAERQSRLRPFSKWEIEQYIQALDLPVTVLRPTVFMDYVIGSSFDVPRGTFTSAFNPEVTVQLIAVDDIGAFATLAFDHPDFYVGKTIEIAGDALTPPQIAAAISHTIGRTLPSIQIPIETLRQHNADAALAYDFVNMGGYQADIPALRKLHPGLMDFATWLEKVGKTQLEAWKQHGQMSK
ncbi:NmrA/HSCARG family protein [Ktedonosporobacter rubrisoli]|uniref:NmrA/HSCARG family protein n=1 Tax=Ktedonosporobacter rubrisoli TaxID=2509675 RepID=A0A4P6JVJ4_KTERU|nr:NmrA/HSCARG family protein [Ktedonosporobacter rubrisoli]QBD79689.1 NmrA/HSCARG family protein [Ktedonosporobacter rubrisoli]